MTERRLRAIAARLDEISTQAPELTGLELAYERGNVSQEEWHAANVEAKAAGVLAEAELAKIDDLRARLPTEVDAHVDTLLAQLAEQLSDATARLAGVAAPAVESALRFKQALLPDLVATLAAWRARTPSRYAYEWAWRIVYSTTDECAELLRPLS